MADPRTTNPMQRRTNHSPLMKALTRRQMGDIVNFCPFKCEDHELDENGHCGHLIGFYNGGNTFEPRVVRKSDKRIITCGEKRQPMKNGYKLVKITTSARVYAPVKVPELTPRNNDANRSIAEIQEQERQLVAFAERIRNPVLDGEWDESAYAPEKLAAAANKDSKEPSGTPPK